MNRIDRRSFLRRTLAGLGGAAALAATTRAPAAELACVESDSEPLRGSLNYADPAPDAAKACRGCGYFRGEPKSACARCDIMSGPVSATGHCDSWVART